MLLNQKFSSTTQLPGCGATPLPLRLGRVTKRSSSVHTGPLAKLGYSRRLYFRSVASQNVSAAAVGTEGAVAVASPAADPTEVLVSFAVPYKTNFGEVVKLVGSAPCVGSWNLEAGKLLTWSEGNVWQGQVTLPPNQKVECKFVVTGNGASRWEEGGNRVIQTPAELGHMKLQCLWNATATMELTFEPAKQAVPPPAPNSSAASVQSTDIPASATPKPANGTASPAAANGASAAANGSPAVQAATPAVQAAGSNGTAAAPVAPGQAIPKTNPNPASSAPAAPGARPVNAPAGLQMRRIGKAVPTPPAPSAAAGNPRPASPSPSASGVPPTSQGPAPPQSPPSASPVKHIFPPVGSSPADAAKSGPPPQQAPSFNNGPPPPGPNARPSSPPPQSFVAWPPQSPSVQHVPSNVTSMPPTSQRPPTPQPPSQSRVPPPSQPPQPPNQMMSNNNSPSTAQGNINTNRPTSPPPQQPVAQSPQPPKPAMNPSPPSQAAPTPSAASASAPPSPTSTPSPLQKQQQPPAAAPPAAKPSGSRSAGRWTALGHDSSDDQQDITRGKNMVDSLFQGPAGVGAGTHNAVMSSSDYLSSASRNFNNIEDGYYISPSFLDKIAIHVAKNFMDLPKVKIPLILGIWGGKGQGKTFQCSLAFKKLGITPIVMSAGELESGNAGEPAKLIRQRYREASDIIKKGKMCALFINDLDAGAGRLGLGTQYTVNNQMVNATLMNIADSPTNVQLPGVYKNEEIPRVPIICTGNDFSTLYAPLIRDGRMEKYYWNPTREDRIGVCMGIFQEDDVDKADVERLVDAFPGQSIDFFGALRARVYDDKVRSFVSTVGMENLAKRLVNSKEGKVVFDKEPMKYDTLMKYGRALVEEQENVKRVQLAEAYLSGAELAGDSGTSLPEGYTGMKKPLSSSSPPSTNGVHSPSSAPKPSSSPSSNPRVSAADVLTQDLLALLKVNELADLAKKKAAKLPKNSDKDMLIGELLRLKAKLTDLDKGQLGDVCMRLGLKVDGSVDSMRQKIRATLSGKAAEGPVVGRGVPSASSSESSSPSSSNNSSSSGISTTFAVRVPAQAPAPRSADSSPHSMATEALGEEQLAMLKVDDLMSLGRAKQISIPRSVDKPTLVAQLAKAKVTLVDLSKSQLSDLCSRLGMPVVGKDVESMKQQIRQAAAAAGQQGPSTSRPAAPTPSAASAPAPSTTSAPLKHSSPSPATPQSSDRLTQQQVALFKIDDLAALCRTKRIEVPRNSTRDDLAGRLVASGLSLQDLTKGQLMDMCIKLQQPITGDIATLQQRVRQASKAKVSSY